MALSCVFTEQYATLDILGGPINFEMILWGTSVSEKPQNLLLQPRKYLQVLLINNQMSEWSENMELGWDISKKKKRLLCLTLYILFKLQTKFVFKTMWICYLNFISFEWLLKGFSEAVILVWKHRKDFPPGLVYCTLKMACTLTTLMPAFCLKVHMCLEI
jgi:hypothetical protein